MTDTTAPPVTAGPQVGAARERAAQRLRRQRDLLRPLGWAIVIVVAAAAAAGTPQPGVQGRSLGVLAALALFAVTLLASVGAMFPNRPVPVQTAVLLFMGVAGAALVAQQSQGSGTTELAAGAAVWMAMARLPLPLSAGVAAAVATALDVAAAIAGSSAVAVAAGTLLVALLAVVALFIRQARTNQDRAEVFLAELEEAREAQVEAAAVAERGRIAGELHDVLAHSLSGAAIQLQAARKLAARDGATPPVREAIDRAGALVRSGLGDARVAVGALRGDSLPGVDRLEALVAAFAADTGTPVTLAVEGVPRLLAAEVGLTLFRGVQEALTNVARHAPGATTVVTVRYDADTTVVSIVNAAPSTTGSAALAGVGGGRGVSGMRERCQRVGGSATAGPSDEGWRVELTVRG